MNGRTKVPQSASMPVSAAGPVAKLFYWLLPALIFLALSAQGYVLVCVFAVLTLLFAVGKSQAARWSERTTILTLAIAVSLLLELISGLYSHFPTDAEQDSFSFVLALALFAMVLFRLERDRLRYLLLSLTGALTAISLLCIDGSSLGFLTRGFAALMKLFWVNCDLSSMGYETGVRITGIYTDANISAGLIAFALLLGLYLIRTAVSEKERFILFLLLGANALAFFLSFSMGAMGAFALSCLVYLLATEKGARLEQFLLMLVTVLWTVAVAFVVYPCLGRSGAVSLVPLLCAVLCGVPLWAVNRRLAGGMLLAKINHKGRTAALFTGGLVLLAILYMALAVNLTGSVTLSPGETLSRAANLDAGSYTVSAEAVPGVQATIYSQNDSELMMHTQSTLYEGSLADASFTVPENSKIIWFDLSGDGVVQSVVLSDGTALPLGYRLLPGFAANRLQGLWANQNFIQRLVFFRDGLKLWRQSPVWGHGLSGVEGALTSVQSFYYETKYIHNQFIQVLDETGLIGLAAFLFLLGSAITTLWRRRKENRTPLFAALAGCLAMMIAHSLTEFVWSTGMYLATVCLLLAAILIAYGKPLGKGAAVGRITAALILASTTVFTCLFTGSVLAERKFAQLQASSPSGITSTLMTSFHRCEQLEVYNDESYMATYIANATANGSILFREQANEYAQRLRASREYTACFHVAAYYDLPLGKIDAMFEDSRSGIAQEASNPDAWNNQFEFYEEAFYNINESNVSDYIQGILDTLAYLDEYNQGRMEEIFLTEKYQAFADLVTSLKTADAATSYQSLSEFLA